MALSTVPTNFTNSVLKRFDSLEREDMIGMTENFANGPSAAYWIKVFSLCLSLVDDVSLKSGTEGETFIYLKDPDSLKVSSKDVIEAVAEFFRIVYNSMAEVTTAFYDVPEKMEYIKDAVKKRNNDSAKILSWSIACIEEAVKSSSKAVTVADKAAKRTYNLVAEFSKKVPKTQGFKDRILKETVEKIKNVEEIHKAKKEAATKAKEVEENEYKIAEERTAAFLAQMKKDDGFWRNLSASLQDIVYARSSHPTRRQQIMNNLEYMNRMAQESRQRADQSRRDRAAAYEEALQLLNSLSNLKAEEVNLNEIIKYLPDIVKYIEKVENALSDFRRFFDAIKRKVNSNLIKYMNEFINLAKKEGGDAGIDFLDTLEKECIKLCATGIAFLNIAKIFKILSNDFMFPQIREARQYFANTKAESLAIKKSVCNEQAFINFNDKVTSIINDHNNRIPKDVTYQYSIKQ